ncbi:MAG: ABC transporter permease [Geodermatophilaceae bacterium]|nr:ABC transporter permease [Geodermatophilaceae bacterium]MDQ3457208.1 ABC transporter permease [Actinomycetota bacterium]
MTALALDLDEAVVGRRQRTLLRRARFVGVPLAVALACLAMYLYVQSQDLDNIERRIITFANIRRAAGEQIEIALWATALTLVIAVPLGIALTRPWARRIAPIVIAVANIGQGIPAIGLLFFVYIQLVRSGSTATVLGMAIYAILPVLRGTMVGLQQVDRGVVKAARGMGMGKGEVLVRVEMPLAVPILLTGVRTALVLTVATAVLAAFIGGGTFGSLIISGQAQGRPLAVAVGSLGAASLAILADWVGGIVEDLLRPKGL